MSKENNNKIPSFFKPILWSYDFEKIDIAKHKKTIIIQAINYGDFIHWGWLIKIYGRTEIKNILEQITATEIKPRTLRLAEIIFDLKKINYAPRSTYK